MKTIMAPEKHKLSKIKIDEKPNRVHFPPDAVKYTRAVKARCTLMLNSE